jgi:hypothetical protein
MGEKIKVTCEQEFNEAIAYFKAQGYKPNYWQTMDWNYAKTVCHHPNNLHVVCNKDGIGWESVDTGLGDLTLVELSKKEQKMSQLKVGDIVRVNNCNLMMRIKDGRVCPYSYVYPADMDGQQYRVMQTDCKFPVQKDCNSDAVNNLLLVRVDNPADIVMTCERFVSLVDPPIYIGKDIVYFNQDGSIQVGCTSVSKETLDKIIKKLNE